MKKIFLFATLLAKTLAQPISIPIQPNLPPFTYDEDVDAWIHPNYPSEELKEAIHEWCTTYSPANKRENCQAIVAANAAVALRETRKQEGALIAAFKQVPEAGIHGLTPKFFQTVSSIYNVEFGMFFLRQHTITQRIHTTHTHTHTHTHQVPKPWHHSYTLWYAFTDLKQLWKSDTDTQHRFLHKDLPIML